MTTKHIINSLKLGKKVPNMLRYVIVLVPLLSLAVRGSCPVHLGPGGVHESDHHSYDERKVSLSQNQEPSSDMSDIDSYYYDFKIVEDFKIQMYKHKILNNLGMNIEPEKMKKMDDRKLRIELARIEEEKQNRKTQLASQVSILNINLGHKTILLLSSIITKTNVRTFSTYKPSCSEIRGP